MPLPQSDMTMRDVFAAQAMAALISSRSHYDPDLAALAYRIADAMLAEREKGEPE